jgi:hypothetical protein
MRWEKLCMEGMLSSKAVTKYTSLLLLPTTKVWSKVLDRQIQGEVRRVPRIGLLAYCSAIVGLCRRFLFAVFLAVL